MWFYQCGTIAVLSLVGVIANCGFTAILLRHMPSYCRGIHRQLITAALMLSYSDCGVIANLL
jgi:hypothetical protein